MRAIRVASWAGALALGAGVGAAGAGWQAAENVSGAVPGMAPRVTVDPLGNFWALWQVSAGGYDRFAIRPPDGTFGVAYAPPASVGAKPMRVGFDAAGNAIVAFLDDGSTLKAVRRTAGPFGTFGTVQNLGAARSFDLSVNPAGDAMVVWDTSSLDADPVKAAFRPAGDATLFGAAVEAGSTVTAQSNPLVVLDPNRAAVVVFRDGTVDNPGSPYDQTVYKQVTQPAGSAAPSFGGETDVGPSDGFVHKAQNAAGRAVIAWQVIVTSPELLFNVQATIREPGGAFGSPVTISPTAVYDSIDPVGFVAADGSIGLGWGSSEFFPTCTSGNASAGFAVAPPGGGFGAYTLRGDEAGGGLVAALEGAEPILAWTETAEGEDPCQQGGAPVVINGAVGLGGGVQVLSAEGAVSPEATGIARAPDGSAFVVWEEGAGTSYVKGAYYDVAILRSRFELGNLDEWPGNVGAD